MADLTFGRMQEIQKELQEKYFDQWGGLCPEKGRDTLLWMIGEVCEAADVIKKYGDQKIMTDEAIRNHFIEELCDVMMHFNDVALCYRITPEELEQRYTEKHNINMRRW